MIEITPPTPETPPTETIVARIRASAAAHPEDLALVCVDARVTCGTFDTRISCVANALLAMGLRKGDNVAVLSANSVAYAEVFMGTLRACGCVTPLSSIAAPEALHKMLVDCGAKTIFVAAQYYDLVAGFIDDLPLKRFVFDFERDGYAGYEAELAQAVATDSDIPIEMSDAFNLIYSSGTTGTPKGTLHNHWMRAAQMERVSANGYDNNARTLISSSHSCQRCSADRRCI